MKDFDLEAAKRGAAVCTRDGREARILCFDAIGYSNGRIIALVKSENNTLESCFSYNDIGIAKYNENNLDLILKMRDDNYMERLERGEYGNQIADVSKMVAPTVKKELTDSTCKESLPVGLTKREWFAGMALAGIFAGRNWPHEAMIPVCINCARNSVELADALVAELEKTEK